MTKSTTPKFEETGLEGDESRKAGVGGDLWALAWTLGAALFAAVFVADHVSRDWLLLQCLRDGHGRAEWGPDGVNMWAVNVLDESLLVWYRLSEVGFGSRQEAERPCPRQAQSETGAYFGAEVRS